MTNQRSQMLKVSAPGRICLFGEHQDYLNLPVIACAINLRISVSGDRIEEKKIVLDLPDIKAEETFSLDDNISYVRERDYFRSVFNVLRRQGLQFSGGVRGTIRGKIPIKAGASSSSALVVAWTAFLAALSGQNRRLLPEEIAELAHRAEVLEFSEPGGMMDQYSAALGGILFLDFWPQVSVERLHAKPGVFVLGDSGEPKDTMSILARVKHGMSDILGRLRDRNPAFSLRQLHQEALQATQMHLTKDEFKLLQGTWRNYRITLQAKALLQQQKLDAARLGQLLNEHHAILRDTLRISTPKIDRMIEAALSAGAYGAKINGSGGGGCMFAYVSDNPEDVAEAISRSGGQSFIVKMDEGVRIEVPSEARTAS